MQQCVLKCNTIVLILLIIKSLENQRDKSYKINKSKI